MAYPSPSGKWDARYVVDVSPVLSALLTPRPSATSAPSLTMRATMPSACSAVRLRAVPPTLVSPRSMSQNVTCRCVLLTSRSESSVSLLQSTRSPSDALPLRSTRLQVSAPPCLPMCCSLAEVVLGARAAHQSHKPNHHSLVDWHIPPSSGIADVFNNLVALFR